MPEQEELTYSFLDIHTVTVRNSRGAAATFSINTKMSIEKYDRMLEYIKQEGWTNLKLIIHTPSAEEEMAGTVTDASDTGIDGALTEKDLARLGVSREELERMYRFAQCRLVDAFDERLTKNSDKK